MDNLFNFILADTSSQITLISALCAIGCALLLSVFIAVTYYITQEETYQRSMAITLLMLPIILSVIIVFIGSNIARAFSLAGTLSIIRFRSAPGDPKDIGFIFFGIAAGLSCGVGLYGYGAVFTIILCTVIIITEKCSLFEKKHLRKHLKITIPENLNYQGAFDEILVKYTQKYKLNKIKTPDLGSLFELCYFISIKKNINEQEFINELRCRNGNLNIILSEAPTTK